MTRTPLAYAAVALLVLLPFARGGGQLVLNYNHASKTALLSNDTSGQAGRVVRSGETVYVPAGSSIQVRVRNTNTALYRVSTDTTSVPATDMDPLRNFLGRLGPYVPELAIFVRPPGRSRGESDNEPTRMLPPALPDGAPEEAKSAWRAGLRAERGLVRVDSLVRGGGGLHQTATLVLGTFEEMRQSGQPEAAAKRLRDSLALPTLNCERPSAIRLRMTSELIAALEEMVRAQYALEHESGIAAPSLASNPQLVPLRDSLVLLRKRALTAVGDYDQIIAAAYRVERLASTAANACSSWMSDAGTVTGGRGRSITVKVEPRTDPEIARVADRGAVAYSAKVLPKPRLTPALGLAFLVAPDARFPTFGTRTPATGGGTEIFESGAKDARFTWGVTLGLTWLGLDQRERSGVALWLPELIVSPAGDTRAFGLGTAASWKAIKLGVGALWVRHPELVDQNVGDKIPNKDFLATRDTYSPPKFYFSLSVFDVPPFLPGK